MKRLFFLTPRDLRFNPFPELALPVLSRNGWEITVVAPGANQSVLHRCLPYPCRRHELAVSGGRLSAELAILSWLQHARCGRYDVIYLQGQPLGPRAALGLIGPLFGKRLVYHTHDYYDPIAYRAHALLEGWLSRRACLHLNGEFHRACVVRALYRLKRQVLVVPPNLPAAWPLPARSEQGRRAIGARSAADVVLMLHGGRSRNRATDELLVALSLLPPRFRIAMTCNRDADLSRFADKFGIADRITCLGQLDYADLLSYTVNADIGIMLHRDNDLGNFFQGPGRLTEYMACGLPVLASHFTGLQVLLSVNGIGRCANPESPEEIAARLLEIEMQSRTGVFHRSAIRKRFLDAFAFDHWEPAVAAAFEDALRGRLHSPAGGLQFSRLGAPCYVPGYVPGPVPSDACPTEDSLDGQRARVAK